MQTKNENYPHQEWDPFTTKREPKVTIGFKAAPHLKIKLSEAANELGFTTSEFIESLLLNFQDIKTFDKSIDDVKVLNNEMSREIVKLKSKVAFYECPKLKEFHRATLGETGKYVNENGQPVNLKINTIEDTYTFIINSFKIDEE